ncbi:MAG TPA: hypothetical protein ENJ01_09825 [Gammaproteobacteria bacterium]|nr:hypothetical protein [Gammaproteobacteria bacterium]
MAKDDDELELSSEGGKSGGKKTLVLIIVGVILLVGISVGATLYLTGALGGGDEEAADEEAAAEPVEQAARYLDLNPEFIVNFEDQNRVSYLQVDIQVMTRDSEVIKALETHNPRVRAELVMLLSGQNYDVLRTREGKEKLAADIKATLNTILKKEIGKEGVEEIYFTSFIMQ